MTTKLQTINPQNREDQTSARPTANIRGLTEMSKDNQSRINMVKWKHEEDGPLGDKAMASKLDKMGYRSIRYVFHPGTDFPDHTHPMTKMDAITSGQFSVTMYGQRIVMEPGDIIEVPKNTVHSAQVVGTEPVVFFDSTK